MHFGRCIPVLIALVCLTASAQDGRLGKKENPIKQLKEFEAKQIHLPGPEHGELKWFAGSWKMSGSYFHTPGQPPVTFSGTAKAKRVLGGRFLSTESESKMGEDVVQTMGFMGYDRRSKEFTNHGCDTLSTYCVNAAGGYTDSSKKVIKMYGEDEDKFLNITQKYFFIYTITGKNSYTFEVIFVDHPGFGDKGEHKVLEITYTRAR